jgi:hypothetical protein
MNPRAGILRTVWAFFAAFNEIPKRTEQVKPKGGFNITRGPYKSFLEFKTVTLDLPPTEVHNIARQIVARVRQRLHKVSAHWRRDRWHWPDANCQHEWLVEIGGKHRTCGRCDGREIRVPDHLKGSAEVGILFTDHAVTHS